jgi:tetratricopeptide (TPR) repeat protein
VPAGAAVVLLFYFGYNSYTSFNNIHADFHFLKGAKGFAEKNFRDCAQETNKAIYANGNCSVYRYILALNVYRYASSTSRLEEAGKKNLLEQALDEVNKAEKNFINRNDCEALKSLILFELGRKNEAVKIRDEVLSKNRINSDYRVSLAYYYFNSGDSTLADEMIESVLNIVPGSVNALSAAAFFSFKRGETEKVKFYCHKIFEIDPGNKSAAELLKYVK